MKSLKIPVVYFSEHEQSLRREIRQFIYDQRENGTFEPKCDSWLSGYSPQLSRKLGERGWIGMTWPKRYGGHERSAIDRYVVTEELLAAGAPVSAHWIADRQSGPLLLRFGTEQQREFYLPKIAIGECYFAIGLSEPNAGSDLAAVNSRAIKVENGWILNGSKIWTSGAHFAHYMISLCRTSPLNPERRHDGMTQFIVDLSAPGVTVRPIHLMTGEHHFNEVIFEDVFIPDEMVIGEVGNGWKQGMTELAYERSGPERFLSTFSLLEELLNVLQEKPDKQLMGELSKLVSRLWTLRHMSIGIAQMLQEGITPDIAAALVKDMGTRFEQQVAEIARLLVSVSPSTISPSRFEKLIAQAILHAPGFTLRGGTTEILRGIVAKGVIAN
ncbi:acyl-CoA dehydrogenase family protein [Aneurinibacillus sp. Ricciae_BoGa-3]|uniref:acyl-CoA dehydrogenase family protein n=1 Tax=Aneurinibacillus sp. Ricciae_BoGa-3 TaxID=3022697 RepID=UPI002341C31C|nr:acyl-CoA dehydrogenase family protein [Aneurinibacillus sp. Ricciae_BoGa-3]WCK56359.1 acyl-CoA dehydrogenase family protein [Aneurinibacillus sp. Ricciae_BoGa-3]